jgi:hypothetical protein
MKDLDLANIETFFDSQDEGYENFVCPCCDVTRAELNIEAGLDPQVIDRSLIPEHHDHISDGLSGLITFGASPELVDAVERSLIGFDRTLICHRCNSADYGLLKQRFIVRARPELRDLVSFPPSAIRAGVIRVPGGKHVFNENAGGALDSELEGVIRRAEIAADLINGIRNAVVGADQRQLGEIINAVLDTFLRDGSPLEIRHEVLGPLSWSALIGEMQWAQNTWAPPCDLTGGPVRGGSYMHDFHTGDTVGGFKTSLPEEVQCRFAQIMTFQKHSHRGPGFNRIEHGYYVTEFSEPVGSRLSCTYCTPGAKRVGYVCVDCKLDGRLVRDLLCISEHYKIPLRKILSCVSWNEEMTVRTINMSLAVELFRAAYKTVRHSVLDVVKEARPRNIRSELSELVVRTARNSADLPGFLEALKDHGVLMEVSLSPCEKYIDWVRFTYEGLKFKQGAVHFGPGEIRAYGITYDPATDLDRVLPFHVQWRREKQ